MLRNALEGRDVLQCRCCALHTVRCADGSALRRQRQYTQSAHTLEQLELDVSVGGS